MTRYTNTTNVPLALAVFLATDYYDHDPDPYVISATTLLKPVRQIVLAERLNQDEVFVDLADMMNNRLGTAIHQGIDDAWMQNYYKAMQAMGIPERVIQKMRLNPVDLDEDIIPIYLEQRVSKQLGKWTITGKFDFVGEGRVQDFKTTSVWTYKNQVNSTNYAMQGSIYRWLSPDKITEDWMDIHYIFMDWKAGMIQSDPNYPKKRFHTQSFELNTLQATQNFIQDKLTQIEKYRDAPEEDIPWCSDEDLWRSEPVWKYYKNPDKTTRSTKNFDNYQDAMLRYIEDGSVGLVKEVPGQVKACKYCPAFSLCSQKDALIASGDLVI